MKRDDLWEYLNSVNVLRLRYERALAKCKSLREQCERMTQALDGMPHSAEPGHQDAMLASLAQASIDADLCCANMRERKSEVEAFLERLENPLYRTILQLRYVDNLRWPEVIERLEKATFAYSRTQVFRLHGDALVVARRLYDAERSEDDG